MPDRRISLVAFGVFVVLAILVLATRSSGSGPAAVEATAALRLVDLDAASITRVRVHSGDGDLDLEKVDGAWGILSPLQGAADSVTVDALVSSLASLTVYRNLGPDVALAEFGLDPVSTTVSLTGADGREVVVEVGSSNPDATRLYVRVSGSEDVLLVYSYQLDRLIAMVAEPPLPPTPTPEVTTTVTTQP